MLVNICVKREVYPIIVNRFQILQTWEAIYTINLNQIILFLKILYA